LKMMKRPQGSFMNSESRTNYSKKKIVTSKKVSITLKIKVQRMKTF
jgi:hypothetical protein